MLKYKILKINGLILGEKKKPMYSKNRHFGDFFFVVFLACALGSCTTGTHYTNNATILQAEALLNSSPDSAWQLLETMPKPNKLPERDYAAWCLMHEHARYKCDDTITSDSLIRIATNYYDQTDDDTHAGIAHYLRGCILMDLNEKQRALLSLKTAANLLEQTNELNYLGLTYYCLGDILRNDELIEPALSFFNKSLDCFEQTNNKHYQSYAYANIGSLYHQNRDTACLYFERAKTYALEAADTILYKAINATMAREFIKTKTPIEIITDIRPAYIYGFSSINAYLLGCAFCEIGQLDSVPFYIKELKKSNDTIHYYYLKGLYESERGNFAAAFSNINQSYCLRQEESAKELQAQTYRINKRYDLEREQERAMALTIDKQRLYLWVSALTIGVILLVVLALWLVLRSHQERARHALKQLKTEAEMERLQTEIRAKRSYLRELLIQKLEVTQQLQVAKIQKRYTVANEPDWVRQLLSANTFTTPTQWKVFITQFNALYNNALDVLPKRYPLLTDGDLVAIGLFSLEFNITQTCILLNRAKQSIYSRRVLIKHHLGVPLDTDLEAWSVQMIQEFL